MTTGLLTPTHVAILLIVVLLILGPKRLPQAGRAIGQSLREFKHGITGCEEPQALHPDPHSHSRAEESVLR
jgi:sec-independent protein translocase protein TatA